MEKSIEAYQTWADVREDQREHDFKSYAYNIAEARYVIRRVTRIINEEAKRHGLDPLLHQALLQIYGTRQGDELAVSALADRLDVPAAFASRLVSQLETRDFVRRTPSTRDRRVTLLSATDEGFAKLREIDHAVHYQMAYFQRQLGSDQRIAALAVFAFYVGIDPESPVARALRAESEH